MACQALIREANTQASELRQSHDTAALEYRRKRDLDAAKINHQRNWQAPIIQLPVEVFSDILLVSLEVYQESRIWRLRDLAGVAKHWRDVVVATPRLWTVAAESMSAPDLALTLRKAKRLKLDVIFSPYSPRPGFSATMAPLASRWRSLQIRSNRLCMINACLRSEARFLEDIEISNDYSGSFPLKALKLCEGVHLRHVDISQVVLPWESSRLTRLVTLRLDDIKGQAAPSVQQVVTILAASPTLESLVIKGSDVRAEDSGTTNHTSNTSLIQLPNLLHLQLSDIQPQVCQGILSRLRLANCRKLQVTPKKPISPSDPAPLVDYDAPNVVEAISSSLPQDDRLRVYVATDCVQAISRDHEKFLPLSCSSGVSLMWRVGQGKTGLLRVMEKISVLLEHACRPEARVSMDLTDGLKDFAVDCIRGFRSLQSIDVGHDLGEAVVRYLGQRLTSDDGEEEWPCPNLRHINLRRLKGYAIGDIRKWASGRWKKYKDGEGPTPEGSVDVVPPRGKAGAVEKWRPVSKTKKRR